MINNTSNGVDMETNETLSNSDDIFVVTIWSTILVYALVANTIVLIGIMRSVQMRSATSYWFIISLAICDIIMVLISLLHLVPATAFHEDFVGLLDLRNIYAIFVYDMFWYTAVLKLGLMAVNRFVSIVYPMEYKSLFSPKRTRLIIGILYLAGLGVSVPTLFPCCHTVYDSHYYITVYYPDDTQYSWVDIAVNSFTVILMVFCYSVILYKVRKNQKAMAKYKNTLQRKKNTLLKAREDLSPRSSAGGLSSRTVSTITSPRPHMSRRELRLFLQFFIVSLVFLTTWSTWQWLPRISVSKWIYFTLTSFFFINNSTNPTVYLIFNSTLRKEVRMMFCGRVVERDMVEGNDRLKVNARLKGISQSHSSESNSLTDRTKQKLIQSQSPSNTRTDASEQKDDSNFHNQLDAEHIICISSTV